MHPYLQIHIHLQTERIEQIRQKTMPYPLKLGETHDPAKRFFLPAI